MKPKVSTKQRLQQSLSTYVPGYRERGINCGLARVPVEAIKFPLSSLIALQLKIRQPAGVDSALQYIQFADRVIDSLRNSYVLESDKLQLAQVADEIYHFGVAAAMFRKQFETAYYYSEKNKGNLLLQSIHESKALKIAGIPDSLRQLERSYNLKIAYSAKTIAEQTEQCPQCDSSQILLLHSRKFHLERQLDSLRAGFETAYPAYHALKFKPLQIATVQELQQTLLKANPHLAIVSYIYTDSALKTFVITHRHFKAYRQLLHYDSVSGQNELCRNILRLQKAVSDPKLAIDPNPTSFLEVAHKLYVQLIQPIEEQIAGKELVIIPIGELYKFPFELLLTKPVANPVQPALAAASKANLPQMDWQSLPYLIKNHQMSYHYSISLLLNQWQSANSHLSGSGFLGVAPVFKELSSTASPDLYADAASGLSGDSTRLKSLSNMDAFSPLPGTEQEVRAICDLFGQHQQPAQKLLYQEANEVAWKRLNLKRYKYIHLATHGVFDTKHPEKSALILAPATPKNPKSASDSTSLDTIDNRLTSVEMYGLEMNAELVVLSACQTGSGALRAGEGLIGLTRGLLYAGARNLLVSQWNVNDASTTALMIQFYQSVLSNATNRKALQTAKLSLIKGAYACPFYWAPFVLIGL
jgi:CHAT domain-containing protein